MLWKGNIHYPLLQEKVSPKRVEGERDKSLLLLPSTHTQVSGGGVPGPKIGHVLAARGPTRRLASH